MIEKNQTLSNSVLFVGAPEKLGELKHFISEKYRLITIANEAPELSKILKEQAVFAVLSNDLKSLSFIREKFPATPRVWIAEQLEMDKLPDVINSKIAMKVAVNTQDRLQIMEILKRAYKLFEEYKATRNLTQEVGRQNRELESLNKDLESIVEERTFHIKVSESDEREKINRIRALIRFIKNLTSLDSFEDILSSFRSEIRKFHGLGDPMLYYETGNATNQLLYFRGSRSHYARVPEPLRISSSIREGQESVELSLANILGRPMNKVLYFPLSDSSELGQITTRFYLILEHSLESSEQKLFLDFVNERKQTLRLALEKVLFEQSLSSSIYRWERTFDGIRDPIAIIDADFNLLRANKSFSERVNHKKCFVSWEQRNEVCEGCPVAKTLASGQPVTSQVWRAGRLYSVTSYPIRLLQSDRISNIVNHYIDMTESRELYSRMIQSEKIGALGMLAGNIAHELNNPLTGIRSLAQVLALEAAEGNPIKSDFLEIEKGARRSQDIIKNLLDFSQGQTEIQDLNLDDLVQKTLPMLKTALRNHRSEIILEGGRSMIRVHGHLIQQVIFNLVNNACQAMVQQGTLTLKTEPFVLSGLRGIRLSVKDTGEGIPEDLMQRVFEPFFTTKKDGQGTGLGLSIAKSVVESFNGRIGLESKLKQGSTFWIWIPIIA